MKSQAITDKFQEANVEALAVAVFKDEKATSGTLKDFDKMTGGLIASVIKEEDFKGKKGETVLLRFKGGGGVKAGRLLLVGVGDKKDYKAPNVAELSGAATRFLRKRNISNFALLPRCEGDATEIAQNAMCGVITSQFELDKYKTKDKTDKAVDNFTLCIEGAKEKDVKNGLKRGEIIG
ncbi:MAG TPA: M17 family peptidase N-terminal domain-containing protein, partial [Pyrinomonadaceae bacterium]|nr:M17 family peptidase N-terminal domain-containing protein [Pyrinomonadaceae bacterium]